MAYEPQHWAFEGTSRKERKKMNRDAVMAACGLDEPEELPLLEPVLTTAWSDVPWRDWKQHSTWVEGNWYDAERNTGIYK